MHDMQLHKFRPEFRSGLDALTRFAFERTRPKQVGATILNGPVLAGLTQSFLDALNNGAVPTISSSWQVSLPQGILDLSVLVVLVQAMMRSHGLRIMTYNQKTYFVFISRIFVTHIISMRILDFFSKNIINILHISIVYLSLLWLLILDAVAIAIMVTEPLRKQCRWFVEALYHGFSKLKTIAMCSQ